MKPTIFAQAKVRIGLGSILLALLIGFLFLRPYNPGPFRAVPAQTSILLEFNGLVEAGRQVQKLKNEGWKEVLSSTVFQNSWLEVGAMEQLFHHDSPSRVAFAHNTMLAAYSLHPADSLHPVFILEMGAPFSLKEILSSNDSGIKIFPYQFHSQTLYTVHKSNNERVVVAQKGDILIFSRYSYLVEDALTQLETARGWWSDNKYLPDLNSEAALRLFFRPIKWQAQHLGTLVPGARTISKTLSDNLAWIGIAWAGDKVSALCEPSGSLAGIGAWNGVNRHAFSSVLPDNTAFLAWGGFDNRSLFFQEMFGRQSVDFKRFILPWVGHEAALVITEPLTPALADDRLLIFAVNDSIKARSALESYGETRGLIAHDRIGMFDIFGFQSASLLSPLLGEADKTFQNPYFVLMGPYMVVAPNRAVLEVLVEKYIANQTLAQNTDFLQLEQQLSAKSRGLLILNCAYLPRFLTQLFQAQAPQSNGISDALKFAKTGWLAAELEPGIGRKMKVAFSTQEQSVQPPSSNIFWKTPIAAPAASAVFCIPQPGMAVGTAILLQDQQGQLYCLNPDGKIAWQKHIGEPIISAISGVSYYQNGRNCYLFNTKSQVWILDEVGKEVQGYPLRLKAPASTGLTLVDFDKNAKFNYFLCCENGRVYGFDIYGRAIDGWNPQLETGPAAGPLLHFQHYGKDYLAVLSRNGWLSVFGRDGKPKLSPVSLNGAFNTAPMVETSAGEARIVCANNAGIIYSTDLKGNFIKLAGASKPDGYPAYITALMLDGKSAFCFLEGAQLTVLITSGKRLKTVYASTVSFQQDEIFSLDTVIGLCAKGKRKISLLTNTGRVRKGFPLAGNTPFEFCKFGQQQLVICGNGSAIIAYKIEN